jgi:hypothetical protein
MTSIDYNKKTLTELVSCCKERNIRGYAANGRTKATICGKTAYTTDSDIVRRARRQLLNGFVHVNRMIKGKTKRFTKRHRRRTQRAGALEPLSLRQGQLLKTDTPLLYRNPEYNNNNAYFGIPQLTRVFTFEDVIIGSSNLETNTHVPSIPTYTLPNRETPANAFKRIRRITESNNSAQRELASYKNRRLRYIPINELEIDTATVTNVAPATRNEIRNILSERLNMNANQLPRYMTRFVPNNIRRNIRTRKPYTRRNNNNENIRVYPSINNNNIRPQVEPAVVLDMPEPVPEININQI